MKRILFISALSLIALSSCKKKGCIDSQANNYNTEAKKDDGTCTYDGSAVFWLDASSQLISYPTINIYVYVDGNNIGTVAGQGTTTAPNCGEGGVNYYLDLGADNEKTISYSIKYTAQTANGIEEINYSSGTTKLIGGDCIQVAIQ